MAILLNLVKSDDSATDDLRGVGLFSGFFCSFQSFCHVSIPCDIPDLVDHLRVFFDQKYLLRCCLQVSNMTDSRKSSATALFGLNVDNLAKLASAFRYSIMLQ